MLEVSSVGRGGRGGRAQCVRLGRLFAAGGGVCRQQGQGHHRAGDRNAGGDRQAISKPWKKAVDAASRRRREVVVAAGGELARRRALRRRSRRRRRRGGRGAGAEAV